MTSFETSVEPGQHSGECINLVGLLTKVMRLLRIRYEPAAHTIVFQCPIKSERLTDRLPSVGVSRRVYGLSRSEAQMARPLLPTSYRFVRSRCDPR
jgi:hypothetical protein